MALLGRKDALRMYAPGAGTAPEFRSRESAQEHIERNLTSVERDLPSRLYSTLTLELCHSADFEWLDAETKKAANSSSKRCMPDVGKGRAVLDRISESLTGAGRIGVMKGYFWEKIVGAPLVRGLDGNIWIEDRTTLTERRVSVRTEDVDDGRMGDTMNATGNFDLSFSLKRRPYLLAIEHIGTLPQDVQRNVLGEAYERVIYWAIEHGIERGSFQQIRMVSERPLFKWVVELVIKAAAYAGANKNFYISSERVAMLLTTMEKSYEEAGREFSNLVENIDGRALQNVACLFRLHSIVTDLGSNEEVLKYCECNEFLYNLIPLVKREGIPNLSGASERVTVLFEILIGEETYSSLDIEPLNDVDFEDAPQLSHFAVSLSDYKEAKEGLLVDGIFTRRYKPAVGIQTLVPRSIQFEDASDGGRKKTVSYLDDGRVVLHRGGVLGLVRRAFAGVRGLRVMGNGPDFDYSDILLAESCGGPLLSSLVEGVRGKKAERWAIAALYRGAIKVAKTSSVTSFVPISTLHENGAVLTAMMRKETASRMPFLRGKGVYMAPGSGLNVFKVTREKGFWRLKEVSERLDRRTHKKCRVIARHNVE
eukprot:Plantae.Rhodophyta-Hildenbrandia_rubra.ctg31632.p1 GENE.Plantae.Rhodophyta-Hildenbrandia_rubra.ctg31632~~Plantae.Rhodophyta-Hildenbrandia_rubra.ctg31632.p1  ORF type:complete len:594 (-),score=75.77 Plantae.Rhodophyta-Hildenbrandia_rubra.ctg31632:801-2582(-)